MNGILNPKKQWRFKITTNINNSEILNKQLASIERPKVSFDVIERDDGFTISKACWEPIEAVFREDITSELSNFINKFTKSPYLFQLKIERIDNIVTECWELFDCKIVSVDYGKFDYASTDNIFVKIMIDYKNAVQSCL